MEENNNVNYTSSSDGTYRGYGYTPPTPPKPKKEKKGSAGVATIAICTVISLAVGLLGGFLGTYFAKSDVSVTGDNVVMYTGVTLKDSEGKDITEKMTVGQVADVAKDSVVEITTEAVATGSFMMQYVTEGAGSGVILSKDGYIVTNHHVIDGATSVKVRTTDGESYEAKLIGTDERTDLAVIKIEAENLTSAVFGEFDKCDIGDTVVAIGNPLGQLGGTVTGGIISALDREITIEGNIMTLIQTDTAINPGNSGGGLFNTSGQLIGVINAKSSGEDVEGLGFAIPATIAQPVIKDLIEYGYVTGRVETGIEVLEISDFQTAMYYRVSQAGLYVYSVKDGSKAEAAGFKAGDLIRKVNGLELATEEEYNKILEDFKVGDTVSVTVSRSGRELTLNLELYEYTPDK